MLCGLFQFARLATTRRCSWKLGGRRRSLLSVVGRNAINAVRGLRQALRLGQHTPRIDNQMVVQEKRRLAEEFRQQLTFGIPTNADEAALRQLARQLRASQLIVKVHCLIRSTPSCISCIAPMRIIQSPVLSAAAI
ncbi:hypothetical protein [Chromatium okenii]|uniref:hypothetical protein n=1 Tax=Chromatium okenii TaxID=61644 RepID=UPI0018D56635|nr:hypothetical protein [Chromatium okenii]